MTLEIRSSLVRAKALTRTPAAPDKRQRPAVPWPRGDGRWALIPPEAIPRGHQSVQALVPMRLATCEEVECPRFLRGWTEVLGKNQPQIGHLSGEEIVERNIVGMDGGRAPLVKHHEPGTPCDVVHKVPNGQPPVYIVDGRPVVESEFLDRLVGGAEAVKQKRQRG